MSGRSNKQLSAEELASFVGRTGQYQARAGMTVEIRVTNARESYGRLDLLVEPVAGTGEAWISTALIKLDKPRELSSEEAMQKLIYKTKPL